ncbi:MAG: hypothetical protein MJ131_05330 [Lachnospiraceae bacterium]|nr:hypothetical protein [Lachnospiraceae bacterium]
MINMTVNRSKNVFVDLKKKQNGKDEKKCICCGDNCWRSDVIYCWDCYKYQNYESK